MSCPYCAGRGKLPLLDLWGMQRAGKNVSDYTPTTLPVIEAPCLGCHLDDLERFVAQISVTNNTPNIFDGVKMYTHPDNKAIKIMVPSVGPTVEVMFL